VNQFAWSYQSLQLPTYYLPTSIKVTFSGVPTPAPAAKSIEELTASTEQIHRLRDGELILFRRSDSRIWQYKFKRESGSWHRASTRKSVLDQAKRVAMGLMPRHQ
jgi:SET domain-containing protein